MFKNIPVTISKPHPGNYKNKIQRLLTDIGVKFYINNLRYKPPPIKRPILIKEEQKYDIKARLQKSNDNWNDWKIQIHWNKLEWVNI